MLFFMLTDSEARCLIVGMTLKEWLLKENMTQEAAAKRIGVHEITINRWINGRITPRRAQMARVEEITGGEVKPASFFEPA